MYYNKANDFDIIVVFQHTKMIIVKKRFYALKMATILQLSRNSSCLRITVTSSQKMKKIFCLYVTHRLILSYDKYVLKKLI